MGARVITVTIADDHRLFADGLAEALRSLPDIAVGGVAYDGIELLSLVQQQRPDVLIVDLEMPQAGGIEVLKSVGSRVPTIVVTMHADDEHRAQAVAAGAAGFLSKSTPLADLAAAIRAVASGEQFSEPTTLSDMFEGYQEPILDPGAMLLTPRERELLTLLGGGVTSTDELAERLFISKKTVKNHLASIFEKLGVSDRAQAAVEAIRLGMAPRR